MTFAKTGNTFYVTIEAREHVPRTWLESARTGALALGAQKVSIADSAEYRGLEAVCITRATADSVLEYFNKIDLKQGEEP